MQERTKYQIFKSGIPKTLELSYVTRHEEHLFPCFKRKLDAHCVLKIGSERWEIMYVSEEYKRDLRI